MHNWAMHAEIDGSPYGTKSKMVVTTQLKSTRGDEYGKKLV
jgi:hypothetical protein